MSVKMVAVRWRDSFSSNHGWTDTRDLAKDARKASFEIESIGYLLHRDSKHIVLVQNRRVPNGEVAADTISIPVGCILTVRTLQFRGKR